MSVQQNINQLFSQAGHSILATKGLKYIKEQKESSERMENLMKTYQKQVDEAKDKPIPEAAREPLEHIAANIDNAPYTGKITGAPSSSDIQPSGMTDQERRDAEEILRKMATKGVDKVNQKVKFAKHIRVIKKEDM